MRSRTQSLSRKCRPVFRWVLILVLGAILLPLLVQRWQLAAITSYMAAPMAVTTIWPVSHGPSRRMIARMRLSGGRLGNEMFVYASLLGIADRNKMTPVYKSNRLKNVFNITAKETSPFEVSDPSGAVTETSAFMADTRFDSLASKYAGDVTIVGFFQCWRYVGNYLG